MKRLTLAMLLVSSVLASASEVSSLLTGPSHVVSDFYALLSADCSTVFYVPVTYDVDASKSYVLADSESVQISAYVKPRFKGPSTMELRQMQAWARRFCSSAPKLAPYPSHLYKIVLGGTKWLGIGKAVVHRGPQGASTIQIHLARNTSQVIKRLNHLSAEIEVQTLSKRERATAKLSLALNITAEFSMHRYVESVCTEERSCIANVICEKKHRCDYVTRFLQELDAAKSVGRVEFEVSVAEGVPIEVADELREELASRFLMSTFTERSRVQFANTLAVTLGEFNKSMHGTYYDEVTDFEIVRYPESAAVSIGEIGTHFKNDLTKILKGKNL